MHKAIEIRNTVFNLVEQLRFNGVIQQTCKGAEPPTSFPAVIVSLGPDHPEMTNSNIIDWKLTVNTEIQARSSVDDLDMSIQQVREALHVALMANLSLGLPYVVCIFPGGMLEPEINYESDSYSASAMVTWEVKYRTKLTRRACEISTTNPPRRVF